MKKKLIVFSILIACFVPTIKASADTIFEYKENQQISDKLIDTVEALEEKNVLDVETEKSDLDVKADYNKDTNNKIVKMEDNHIEFDSNKENSTFTLLDKDKKAAIEEDLQNKNINNTNTNSIFYTSKIKEFKDSASQIADTIDDGEKKLVESNNLGDGTISYKWMRTYNGYEFDFDFVLVILDQENGKVIQASKRYLSEIPNITTVISSDKAKEIAIQELQINNNLKNVNLVDNKLKIVNLKSVDNRFNPNTRLAYCLKFSTEDVLRPTVIVWVDSYNGQILNVIDEK